MSCAEALERRETFPENPLELPCFVGSLSALSGGNDLVLVKLLIPHNGIAAWVNKEDLTIAQQSATGKELKGFLNSNVISEKEAVYTVEIMDRGDIRQIEVPKHWLIKETARFQEGKPTG